MSNNQHEMNQRLEEQHERENADAQPPMENTGMQLHDLNESTKIMPIYPHGGLHPGGDHYPDATVQAKLNLWCERKDIPMSEVMAALRWDCMNGCFAFWWRGMFVGVETDGHIHT